MLKARKFNKIIALALMFCLMAVSVVGFTPLKAKATVPEVQLYYAQVEQATGGLVVDGYVSVNNGGSNKAVTVHYSLNNGTWTDVSASYYTTDPFGYEVWHFQTPAVPLLADGLNWNFAVRYDVDGATYWDNNGSNNYNLWVQAGNPGSMCWVLGKSALMENYSNEVSGTTFYGKIFLKNLGYSKTVVVRYTTDNWATYTDLNASYEGTYSNGLEKWSFSTTVPNGPVKYAVCYTVNGTAYWDNNFGANYTAS